LDPTKIRQYLREFGCDGCELGKQPNFIAPVVYRGNAAANKMIIGEAPGLKEDAVGKPFTGPAGQLMDRIFASVGWDTEKDWYITNVVKCRPVAPAGSYSQNSTPTNVHRQCCRPYIEQEIDYLKPHTIVLLGKSALTLLVGHNTSTMAETAGSIFHNDRWPDVTFFVMYHPAALLHAQGKSPDAYNMMRQATWAHIKTLREIVDEIEGV